MSEPTFNCVPPTGSSLRRRWPTATAAKARLASKDCASDGRCSWHCRDHAGHRQGQDGDLALAGTVRRGRLGGALARRSTRSFRVGPVFRQRPFVFGRQLNAPTTPTAYGNALAGQCQVQRCIGVSVCPRNAFVGASRRPQRASDTNCRRCNSETKMEAGLAAHFSTRGARHSIPEHSESYICHDLSRIQTFRSNN